METKKLDMFLIRNEKYFNSEKLTILTKTLCEMDDSEWTSIQFLKFKDPTTLLIISLFFGVLGIDRFIIGDTGKGIGKLLTFGGLGIWTIVDWFLIQNATREKNFKKLEKIINM